MQNNVPRLQFAPATQNGATEDFDLNEIFAEYFINEFEDPLNAYTSSMANYTGNAASSIVKAPDGTGGTAPATATGSNTTQAEAAGAPGFNNHISHGHAPGTSAPTAAAAPSTGTSTAATTTALTTTSNTSAAAVLPTGGIRTIFHAEVKKEAPLAQAPFHAAPSTSSSGVSPAAKKPKVEPSLAGSMHLSALPAPISAQSFLNSAPAATSTTTTLAPAAPGPNNATAQGVTIHPGMFLSQQQLASLLPHMQVAAAAAAAAGAAAAGPTATAADPSAANASGGTGDANGARLPLPVGVGIRLGGVGGISPAAAHAAARTPGVATSMAALWGGAQAAAGPPTEQAVAERRQRNREHAKRSRVRKKFMLESLQEQVRELQRENQELRMLVQKHIPEHAMKIISECCSDNPLFADITGGENQDAQELVRADMSLMQSLASGQRCFVLSDPKLPDNPIVFASQGFYELTGYTSKEVLGRNCRFLQGPGTDPKAVDVIRKAVASGSDATVCLLNYKADGSPFWNQFFIAALRDSDNCIVNYVGVQTEIQPETALSSLEDRVNAVMPLQNKDKDDEEEDGKDRDD